MNSKLRIPLCWKVGRRLFDPSAGFFGAAALCGSYLFFRHARLAETDAPATLFVTLAIYCLLRADDADRSFGWMHAFAAATALAFNCKQGPGCYPLIFLLGYCAVERRWQLALRFVTSGAILTLLVLGGGWYGYILSVVGRRQFFLELHEVGTGEDHHAPLYVYLPQLLQATMPWTALMILGLVQAAKGWRSNRGGRIALLWAAACLLPLGLAGNRQFHYLVPSMPPLLLLAGWAMAAACRPREGVTPRDDADPSTTSAAQPASLQYDPVGPKPESARFVGAARMLLLLTAIVAVVAALSLPIAAAVLRKSPPRLFDFVLTAALLLGLVRALSVRRRHGMVSTTITLLAVPMIFLPAIFGIWYPSIDKLNPRDLAKQIRSVAPQGPYLFAGDSLSLTLCFYLRTDLPLAKTPARLTELIRTHGVRTVLARTAADRESPTTAPSTRDPAVRLVPVGNFHSEEHQFGIYRVEGAP